MFWYSLRKQKDEVKCKSKMENHSDTVNWYTHQMLYLFIHAVLLFDTANVREKAENSLCFEVLI